MSSTQYSRNKPVATGRSVRDTSCHIAGDAWITHSGNGPPPFLPWTPCTLDHPSGRSLPRPITRVETSRWHPGPPSARFLESGVRTGPELTAVSECPALSRVLARLEQPAAARSLLAAGSFLPAIARSRRPVLPSCVHNLNLGPRPSVCVSPHCGADVGRPR